MRSLREQGDEYEATDISRPRDFVRFPGFEPRPVAVLWRTFPRWYLNTSAKELNASDMATLLS